MSPVSPFGCVGTFTECKIVVRRQSPGVLFSWDIRRNGFEHLF
jgi:hypothetical protein